MGRFARKPNFFAKALPNGQFAVFDTFISRSPNGFASEDKLVGVFPNIEEARKFFGSNLFIQEVSE